jgi:hypothetical protein
VTSAPLWGRRARFVIQRVGDPAPVSIALAGDVSGAVDREVSASQFDGLHVRFKVEKHNLGQPNTMEAEIFNLASATRRKLMADNAFVQLFAGYQSDWPNPPMLFSGNARTIDHVRQGADWVTKVQCGDGEGSYRFGAVSKSFPKGTSSADIAAYLAGQAQLGDIDGAGKPRLDISDFLNKAPTLTYPKAAFVQGYAAQGNAFELLQRLLGSGYELSIQDGELRVLQPLQGTLNVVLLSPRSGLLGSPEHGTPTNTGLPSVLKLKCLLNPRIRPGDVVRLESAELEGNFRAQRVIHTGDLGGNDWQTEIEALPMTNSLAPPA